MTFHARSAAVWLVIGLVGVAQFAYLLVTNPHILQQTLETPIAASIPVLYFISVYANLVGHWSSYQASKVEKGNDDQMQEVMSELDAIKEKLGIK
jgi:hypothetical protein